MASQEKRGYCEKWLYHIPPAVTDLDGATSDIKLVNLNYVYFFLLTMSVSNIK